jgi:GT2 family glycosyltransferase
VSEQRRLSVVIPTIGRVDLLRQCLDSLAQCEPPPDEVVVVDQSGGSEVEPLVAEYSGIGARAVRSDRRGVAIARNEGLRAAAHDAVLMTDDDCTVAPDWVAAGGRLLTEDPLRIVSGRVLPAGDAGDVPSTITDTEPRDHTGTVQCGVLYTNNVALNRSEVLGIGGFDEAFETAEDNDLCYRWLTSGRRLIYDPSLTVWHHHWRSQRQQDRLYVSYWRGQGTLYTKHLLAGDRRMARLAANDLYWAARGRFARLRGRGEPWMNASRGLLRGLPVGAVRYLLRRAR